MDSETRTKQCRFCGRVLPVDSFPIKPGFVRARYKECAECHALGHSCIPKEPKPKRRKFATEEERAAARQEYQRRYREKNRDKMLKANRANYWHKKGEEPPECSKTDEKRAEINENRSKSNENRSNPKPKRAKLTEDEKKERRRESQRKWDEKNRDRIREYQRRYYHKKKDDVIAKREHAEEAVRETADTGRFYCTQCHQVLPAEDFIANGRQYKLCNDCRAKTRIRKAEKAREEISKRRPKSPNGTSARAEYYRQYYDEHKDEIKAKRCETEPVVLNSQKRMVDMYLKGYSVHEIASRCQATVEKVIETVRDYDGNVNVRICQDCWLYPCFSGMEVISCNLAKTCQKYHRKEAAS